MRVRIPPIRSLVTSASLATVILSGAIGFTQSAKAEVDAAFSAKMKQFLDTSEGRSLLVTAMKKAAEEEQEKEKTQQLEDALKNRVDITAGKSPVIGNSNAKITVIEFSDFQCPYCSRGSQTMHQLLKAYPNDVKVVFKNLPLQFHDQAEPAAKAALAAGKQGKFWEFHDELFGNQQKLGESFFEETAKKLGLNVDQWKKDMASSEIADSLKEDKELAAKFEIRGTPGFFVNGVRVAGAYPFDYFKTIIDRLLAEGAK